MSAIRCVSAVLAVWCSMALVVGQQTWYVHCGGGPGVDFTDLPAAVAAAAPGDTILVYDNGNCSVPYTAPVIDKPLRIEGFLAGLLGFPPLGSPTYPTGVLILGLLEIRGIPAGEQVVLSNLTIRFSAVPSPPFGYWIHDCAGSVLLEDVYVDTQGLAGSVLSIERCARVVLRDSEHRIGGVPITVRDSSVMLSTCLVSNWGPYFFQPSLGYTTNHPAFDIRNSELTLVGSIAAGNAWFTMQPAQPAVRMESSTLRVGPGTRLTGSVWGPPPSYGTPSLFYRAIDPPACQVLVDSRAVVSSNNQFNLPAPIPTEMDTVLHSRVVGGYPYSVSMAGPADGFGVLLFGAYLPAPLPISLPSTLGGLEIDPSGLQVVDVAHLPPPHGVRYWTFTCPASAPVATPFAFQSLTLSPAGELGLTIPSPLTVGWPHGAVP